MRNRFLKSLPSAVLLAALLLPHGHALAGGVTDGGGGTTNPNPANPEWVVGGAMQYGPKALLVWLNAEEANFGRLSDEEKAKSPFRKLFNVSPDAFEVVRHATVEFRMNEPCRDKNNAPWDGSMYATRPEAVCLSPFTMAPKLNETNVYPETIALLMHELSHRMGTDEDEAKEIQQHALWALTEMNLLNTIVQIDLLGGASGMSDLGYLLFEVGLFANPGQRLRPADVEGIDQRMLQIRDKLTLVFLRASFTHESTIDRFGPQFVRLMVLKNQSCANDRGEEDQTRKYCADQLEKAFAGQASVTAREAEARLTGINPSYDGPEYDAVLIHRPDSPTAIAGEMKALGDFLKGVQQELVDLKNVQMQSYRQ